MKITSLEELENFAKDFAKNLEAKTIVLLEGPIGVGKTQFTSYLLKQFTDKEEATSPTFALHNMYETSKFDIHHIDLYRLNNEKDLESTGFWDLFDEEDSIIIIEWSDLIDTKLLPASWKKVNIKMAFDGEARELVIT